MRPEETRIQAGTDWCQKTLAKQGITPCIPSRKGRKVHILHNGIRYKKRHKIKNNLANIRTPQGLVTGRDTLTDRCPKVFLVRMRPG